MNLKRIISALIGLPTLGAILILGNKYIIDILFSIVAIISIHEYFNAIGKKYKPVRWIGYIGALLIAFVHIMSIDFMIKLIIILIPLTIVLLFIKVIRSNMETDLSDISSTFFGICYIIRIFNFFTIDIWKF